MGAVEFGTNITRATGGAVCPIAVHIVLIRRSRTAANPATLAAGSVNDRSKVRAAL